MPRTRAHLRFTRAHRAKCPHNSSSRPSCRTQVLRNGKWVAVNPISNAFVVNISDQIQVLSNGRYKSVLHRVVVNSSVERMYIPTFYCPSPEAIMGPAKELVDDEHPPIYKTFAYSEYYETFWDRGLQTNSCLDGFRV